MDDLASERKSISAMTSDEAIDLIVTIRAKRRDGIASAASNRQRKAAAKAPKKPKRAEALVAQLSADEILNLLAELSED